MTTPGPGAVNVKAETSFGTAMVTVFPPVRVNVQDLTAGSTGIVTLKPSMFGETSEEVLTLRTLLKDTDSRSPVNR